VSTSNAPARLRLSSPITSLAFAVVNSEFEEVARGVGELDVSLPAGIYELQFRAGPRREKRLVSLEPGQVYEDNEIHVEFPSPAPIAGTSIAQEYERAAAITASQTPTAAGKGDAGLLLMVRSLGDSEDLPLDRSTVDALTLLDSRLEPVANFEAGWQFDPTMGWAIWSADLAPGGYALRLSDDLDAEKNTKQAVFDQAVWLSSDWQTLLFVPSGARGPEPSWASVHMTGLGTAWSPFERDVGQALELALWGLREGRAVLPSDFARLLVDSKFENPMLGIIGAHSLLLQPNPDLALLDTVLNNLNNLVPRHPDVAALEWLAAEAGSDTRVPAASEVPASVSVNWPPLLLASYAALIRRDAHDASTIEDDSVAELAAAKLVATDVWTAWRPLDKPGTLAFRERGLPLKLERGLPDEPDELRRASIPDPATKRIAEYLADYADVRETSVSDIVDDVEPSEIGIAVGLPSASVHRGLSEIRESWTDPLTN
jgi:hypothetical protein